MIFPYKIYQQSISIKDPMISPGFGIPGRIPSTSLDPDAKTPLT